MWMSLFGRERNDLVSGIVADVGAAAERDAGSGAPILDDRQLVAAPFGVVGEDVADPPEANASDRADVGAGCHMEHRAVDPVMVLADFLEQQLGGREIRLERGTEQA